MAGAEECRILVIDFSKLSYRLFINNKDLALMKPENKQNNIDGHSRRDVLNIYRAKISQVIG